MWYAILIGLFLCGVSVAYWLGAALKEAGEKARGLEATIKLQQEVLASFARAAKRRKNLEDYIKAVDAAATAVELNQLYIDLLEAKRTD